MNKPWIFVLLVSFAVVFLGCAEPVSSPTEPLEPAAAQKALVSASNSFGLNLFREINQSEKDTNIFISPLSVSMALGMTYNGAAGDTRAAMAEVLELSGLTIEQANQAYKSLIELLSGLDPEVAFQIANSIWYRQGFSVEQEFIDLNQTYFDAAVAALDFNNPGAVETINDWVDQKTNGKIEKIISSIDPLTMMFLINAIYFKGDWTYRFGEYGTHPDSFTVSDELRIPCNMMSQKDATLPYFENSLFQAVNLPYGNGDFSMAVFLPRPDVDLDAVIQEFTTDHWAQWQTKFEESEGDLFMPRFKLNYDLTMNDVLSALGMGIAFDPLRADFTEINSDGELFISKVLHKTFVDVNETGTEAAAVTTVIVGTTSIEPPPDFVMRINRPFIFTIHEQESGTILFMGRIGAPVEEE